MISAHAARFSPQLSLDLEQEPGRPDPAKVAEPPTRAQLAAAALENEFVRRFIAEQVPTWTSARVHRDPPCCLVYEHGEVMGNVSDIPAMIRHAAKRTGLGKMLGLRALLVDEEVLPYTIGLRWAPTHPRRRRWEQRMALKCLLARRDRAAVGTAMRLPKREFVAWAERRAGLAARVLDCTGLTLGSFWRAVRGVDESRGKSAGP
jgi:hypothetical protein